MYEATAVHSNGRATEFLLEDYQIDDFLGAVIAGLAYKDKQNGVISWLPPGNLHSIVIKPNLESPKCDIEIPEDIESLLI